MTLPSVTSALPTGTAGLGEARTVNASLVSTLLLDVVLLIGHGAGAF